MYGKRLSVMQKKKMDTQDRSGSDFNKKKNNNGHERHKREQQIEQDQQRSSSSNTFPFPEFLFYIHWFGRNLDDIDILIL